MRESSRKILVAAGTDLAQLNLDAERALTCNDLADIADAIELLREYLLCEYEEAGTCPISTSLYLQALTQLELAKHSMEQATLFQSTAETL